MTDSPIVSIGLPVKNGEKTIIRALNSILKQTFTNYEVIIADNDSSDETKKVVKNFIRNQENMRLVSHVPEISMSNNFLFTLNAAHGKYFAWLSDDDYWDKDFLKAGVQKLTEGFDFFCPNHAVGNLESNQLMTFDENILHFLMTKKDAENRTIEYINLHFRSHKSSIVYSLFRTDFLKNIFLKQAIEDDGAFGALVVNKGIGYVSNKVYFYKETAIYEQLADAVINFRRNRNIKNLMLYLEFLLVTFLRNRFDQKYFNISKEKSLENHLRLFPELSDQIKKIYKKYRYWSHNEKYQILKN